jgi:hypothetical protein
MHVLFAHRARRPLRRTCLDGAGDLLNDLSQERRKILVTKWAWFWVECERDSPEDLVRARDLFSIMVRLAM